MTKNESLLNGVIADLCPQRLSWEVAMASNPKIFGVIAGGFLLLLSLSQCCSGNISTASYSGALCA